MSRVPIRAYRRWLARYLAPDRGLLAVLALVLSGGIFVRLLAPWFAARFIDRATAAAGVTDGAAAHDPLRGLLVLAGAFLLAGVADQALAVATAHLGSFLAWRATNRLREDAVSHCLRLELPFHHQHGPGVMVERVDGDVRELNNFFAEFALRVIGNLILVVAVLGVIFVVDWRLGLLFTGFSALAMVVFQRVRGVAAPHWRRARESSSVLYGEVEERFGGVPDIRANGAGGYVLRRFAEKLRDQFRLTRRANSVSVAVGQGAGLVMGLGQVVILAAGAVLFRAEAMSLGTVVALAMYTRIITTPLREIIGQIDDLQRATASLTRVQELLDTRPAIRSGPGVAWPDGPLPVAFQEVSFAYPAGGDALRGVSFQLRPGEVLGLLGRTGAGKSTIARLLLRFYDPGAGRVRIGGADLREVSLPQLRRRVGVVTQEVQLFDATVRDNLTLFDPAVPDHRLRHALAEAGLSGWLARQPAGLDTPLSASGDGLSGGEAQLLAVARIFTTDPGVVILDEPTSRLDPVTERRLDAAFDRLLAGRTCLIIAHRLRTLHRADTVLLLADGAVAEYGSRAALAADPGSRFHQALARGDGVMV